MTDRPAAPLCPDCGEPMLDDRDGLTGADWFCANNHPAILVSDPADDDVDEDTCPRCGAEHVWHGRTEAQRVCDECRFADVEPDDA